MEKLLMKVTMRLPEDIYMETKQAAERDHRPILHQVRHFFMRGLEQYRAELRKMEFEGLLYTASLRAPQRVSQRNEEERKRA